MSEANISSDRIKEFLSKVNFANENENYKINWNEIQRLNEKQLLLESTIKKKYTSQSIKAAEENLLENKTIFNKLAILKLNGGLGTSMGLERAKSFILLNKETELSILEIIVNQTLNLRSKTSSPLPLLFMNSYNTHKNMISHPLINKLKDDLIFNFIQSKVPRLFQETLLPTNWKDENGHIVENPKNWCPPGHADVFFSLNESGLLDQLIDAKYEIIFISNGDNIAAIPDTSILKYMLEEKLDWISEVTPKTTMDKKGGVLYFNKALSKIALLEIAQVPTENIENFYDMEMFPYFNVNTIWVRLKSLKEKILKNQLRFPVIVNKKKINNQNIVQLEAAMGAGISCFEKSVAVIVGRERFMPIKNCGDLLKYRSDTYEFDKQNFTYRPSHSHSVLEVELHPELEILENFERYFANIPSLKEARSLKVNVPLFFDTQVKIIGDVEFKCKKGFETSKNLFYTSEIKRSTFRDEIVELG